MIKSAAIDTPSTSVETLVLREIDVVVVLGHAGSTALEVATALLPRLPSGTRHVIADCSDLNIGNFSTEKKQAIQLRELATDISERILASSEDGSSNTCVLFSLIVTPGMVGDLPLFLDHCVHGASSRSSLNFNIRFVISAIASAHLTVVSAVNNELGLEEKHFQNKR